MFMGGLRIARPLESIPSKGTRIRTANPRPLHIARWYAARIRSLWRSVRGHRTLLTKPSVKQNTLLIILSFRTGAHTGEESYRPGKDFSPGCELVRNDKLRKFFLVRADIVRPRGESKNGRGSPRSQSQIAPRLGYKRAPGSFA